MWRECGSLLWDTREIQERTAQLRGAKRDHTGMTVCPLGEDIRAPGTSGQGVSEHRSECSVWANGKPTAVSPGEGTQKPACEESIHGDNVPQHAVHNPSWLPGLVGKVSQRNGVFTIIYCNIYPRVLVALRASKAPYEVGGTGIGIYFIHKETEATLGYMIDSEPQWQARFKIKPLTPRFFPFQRVLLWITNMGLKYTGTRIPCFQTLYPGNT